MSKLFLILNEDINAAIKKGEIIDRKHNPLNYFTEVCFIILKEHRKVDIKILKRLVGDAKLQIHYVDINFKKILFLSFFNMDSFLIENTYNKIKQIFLSFQPDLIRANGMALNFLFAYKLSKEFSKPYVLSLHNQFDELKKIEKSSFKKSLINTYFEKKIIPPLKNANLVIGVYSPINWYADKIGVKTYKTIYNVINPLNITKKENYNIDNKFKIISIGRQIIGRDLSEIIKAVSKLKNVEFLIIGDGEYHNKLIELSKKLGIFKTKVFFKKSVSNNEICKLLPTYDVYIAHSEYAELAKTTMEAMLTGLPCILNIRDGQCVQELNDSKIILLTNQAENYYNTLVELENSLEYRKKIGLNLQRYANETFAPLLIEQKLTNEYNNILGKNDV